MENGRWKMEDGRWKSLLRGIMIIEEGVFLGRRWGKDGRWKIEDGKWKRGSGGILIIENVWFRWGWLRARRGVKFVLCVVLAGVGGVGRRGQAKQASGAWHVPLRERERCG